MEKLLEKLNKLSLPAVILIASLILGGFFYMSQVNKQRSIERQQQIKIEQDKQEQLDRETKEKEVKEQAEQALNTCISYAEEGYRDQWLKECKAQGELSSSCVAVVNMNREEYIEKYRVPFEQYLDPTTNLYGVEKYMDDLKTLLVNRNKKLKECSCSLPLSLADRVNESLEKDKAECFKRYPQK